MIEILIWTYAAIYFITLIICCAKKTILPFCISGLWPLFFAAVIINLFINFMKEEWGI